MYKNFLLVLLVVSSFTVNIQAEEKKGVDSLSFGLRSLLTQEMLSVEKAMKSILSDIIAGKYEDVSIKATNIHNSFILKQNLTKSQGHELHTKIPKDFLNTDARFHEIAAQLADAADIEDTKKVNEIYGTLLNSCVKCHSTYATSRFPDF